MRNVLERAMLLSKGREQIDAINLPAEVRGISSAPVDRHTARSLDDVERSHIERTLRAHDQNRSRAAKELRISRATLIKKIKQYRILENGDE
jgi:transcriptional regulator with PAS, ATPase and Fis domain